MLYFELVCYDFNTKAIKIIKDSRFHKHAQKSWLDHWPDYGMNKTKLANIPLQYQSQTGDIRWCSGWKLIFSRKNSNATEHQIRFAKVKKVSITIIASVWFKTISLCHYSYNFFIYDSVWYPPEPSLFPQLLASKVLLGDRWPMTTIQSKPNQTGLRWYQVNLQWTKMN